MAIFLLTNMCLPWWMTVEVISVKMQTKGGVLSIPGPSPQTFAVFYGAADPNFQSTQQQHIQQNRPRLH